MSENMPELGVPEEDNILQMASVLRPTPLLPMKPIQVVNARSARRLFSRLILSFQKGELVGKDAKDLCYLLTSFLQACEMVSVEERLQKLEDKIK